MLNTILKDYITNPHKAFNDLLEEYISLAHTYTDCEKEYIRTVNLNKELQKELDKKCIDCDSEARLKLAINDFEKITKGD